MHERQYVASRHAKDRLAERYQVKLTEETWRALAESIEEWPYLVDHCPRAGTEVRQASVQLQGPDGTILVVPIIYRTSRWAVVILTVQPNGPRLRRHRAAANP